MTDPDFCGIAPAQLRLTIGQLDTARRTLGAASHTYRRRFEEYGLPTEPLAEIGRIADWIDGELPMLRRRHALADAMEHEPGNGPRAPMVRLHGRFVGTAQAREDGRRLADTADRASQMAPEEAGKEFQRIAAVLTAHRGDPDFTSAFFAAMDPRLTKNLALAVSTSPTAEADMAVYGAAFTTAVRADSPAPGFTRTLSLLHGPAGADEPAAVFNRALLQGDDPELWDLAWEHFGIAAAKLLDPADTWPDSAGLLSGIFGMQSQIAGRFHTRAGQFAGEAAALHRERVAAVGAAEKRRLSKLTTHANRQGRITAAEAERVLSRFGMGSFSRLTEGTFRELGMWAVPYVPGLRVPEGVFGQALRAGGKLPVIGTVLTLGGLTWDIARGEEADVAVAATGAGLVGGAFGTWTGIGLVAAAGGPVGWGVAAGVALGFGVGYALSYGAKTPAGRRWINATGSAVKAAASGTTSTIKGWLS